MSDDLTAEEKEAVLAYAREQKKKGKPFLVVSATPSVNISQPQPMTQAPSTDDGTVPLTNVMPVVPIAGKGQKVLLPAVLQKTNTKISAGRDNSAGEGITDNCTFVLSVEPPQSGKTSLAGDYADIKLKMDDRTLIVWVGPCNLMLNSQTCIRMKERGMDSYTLSSKSIKDKDGHSNNYKTVDAVLKNHKKIGVLSVCAHYIRWGDIIKIVENLPVINRIATFIIDEADDTATKESAKVALDAIKGSKWCESIYTMTATPTEKLLERLGSVKLIWTRDIHDKYLLLDNYEHLDINEVVSGNANTEYKFSAVTYAANAIDYFGVRPGSIWFLPSHRKQESHEEMKKMALDKGFNIAVIINGKDKGASVFMPNGECIEENFKKQSASIALSTILSELRKKYPGRSIGITGNLCESRGITIMSEDFIPDYAVFSDGCAGTPEDVYQLFGRCLGPLKYWGKVPMIISPVSMLTDAKEYENFILKMKRESRSEPIISARDLRNLRKQASDEFSAKGIHDFKSWLKHIHKYHGRPLAESTIKNYDHTAKKYISRRVNGRFPEELITNWENDPDDKHHTSCSMKRYNEYTDWKDKQTQ